MVCKHFKEFRSQWIGRNGRQIGHTQALELLSQVSIEAFAPERCAQNKVPPLPRFSILGEKASWSRRKLRCRVIFFGWSGLQHSRRPSCIRIDSRYFAMHNISGNDLYDGAMECNGTTATRGQRNQQCSLQLVSSAASWSSPISWLDARAC